jgi:hypothetical protein
LEVDEIGALCHTVVSGAVVLFFSFCVGIHGLWLKTVFSHHPQLHQRPEYDRVYQFQHLNDKDLDFNFYVQFLIIDLNFNFLSVLHSLREQNSAPTYNSKQMLAKTCCVNSVKQTNLM